MADGLYRSGIGFSALFLANSGKMAGTEIDGSESSMLVSEEKERGDWNVVVNRTRKESGSVAMRVAYDTRRAKNVRQRHLG